MKSLRDAFAQIPDWRENPRYPLAGLLMLISLAMLCGCNGIREIERWAQMHRWTLADRLGFKRYTMPKYGMIRRTLLNVDEAAFSQIVVEWGNEVLSLYGKEKLPAIAIDGKTVRGTRQGELPALELMAALNHELKVVLGQVEVPEGTNEIPTIQTLLEELVLEGQVVTVDAILTQRDIAATIRKKGGIT
jgi:hypothetical protein